jgi:hypothetical protein
MPRPSIGCVVHYVSYGTPGGEYTSECRAAIVTATDRYIGVDRLDLAVLNPTGLFFNQNVPEDQDGKAGGTWHWPERVEED